MGWKEVFDWHSHYPTDWALLLMKIIDRYLFWYFIKTFVICFISIGGLYIVIDGFGNLDSFLEYGEKHNDFAATMVRYYACRSLAIFESTSDILALVAAMFTLTWLQRHNEMTALMASGTNKLRISAPIILSVAAISLFSAIGRETVLPRLRNEPGLGRNAQDLLGDAGRVFSPLYDQQTDILLDGHQIFTQERRIHLPRFQFRPPLNQYGKQLKAEDAYYVDSKGSRPGGYLFDKVSQWTDLKNKPSLLLSGIPILLTGHDYPWLKDNQVFIVSNVSFEQLNGGWAWRKFASTSELIAGLRNPSLIFNADVNVAIHARLVKPLLDVTLLFLGMPLVLTRQNRNIFLAIGYCISIVAVFTLVVLLCHVLGAQALLSPSLAAWLPLIIFIPVALLLSEPLVEWEKRPTANVKPISVTPQLTPMLRS